MSVLSDLLDAVPAISVLRGDALAGALRPSAGTWRFSVTDALAANPPKFVTLRVDPGLGRISGDMFHDRARRRWYCSWRSDALYAAVPPADGPGAAGPRWALAALCAVTLAPGLERKPFAKLFLAFGTTDGAIDPTSLAMQLLEGEATIGAWTFAAAPPPEPRLPSLRQVVIHVDVDPDLGRGPGPLPEAVELVLAEAGEASLSETLVREGIAARIVRASLPRGKLIDIETAETMGVNFPDLAKREEGSFTIILSAAEDEDGADDVPLGRTLGIDDKPRRFGTRRAAVVFPREIEKSCRRQVAGAGGAGGVPPRLDTGALAYRVLFTILHELGHLLNLPHPWERDGFGAVRMTAEPAEPTWMQYGSLFPLGVASRCALGALDPDVKQATRDRLAAASFRSPDGALVRVRYTDQERLHIHHAAHDEITAGGKSFIDAERIRLEMGEPSPGGAFRLVIEGIAAPEDGTVPEVRLADFARLPRTARLQPPSGRVRLRLAPDEDAARIVFRFGAGDMFWLFREERETMDTNRPPRKVVPYAPNLRILTSRLPRPRANLGVVFDEDGARWLEAELPLVSPDFLFSAFLSAPRLTAQVLRVGPRGILSSNQVRLVYESRPDERLPFGDATADIVELLSDEMLPAVYETLLTYRTVPLDGTAEMAETLRRLRSGPVRAALAAHPEALRWLAALVGALGSRQLGGDGADAGRAFAAIRDPQILAVGERLLRLSGAEAGFTADRVNRAIAALQAARPET